jgi:hypothetical protein
MWYAAFSPKTLCRHNAPPGTSGKDENGWRVAFLRREGANETFPPLDHTTILQDAERPVSMTETVPPVRYSAFSYTALRSFAGGIVLLTVVITV